MFYLTVKATGGKLKEGKKPSFGNKKAPSASFDQIANFVGAM